jgi:hypothetical protein
LYNETVDILNLKADKCIKLLLLVDVLILTSGHSKSIIDKAYNGVLLEYGII